MQPVPRIFVSATSRDLKTARTLVSEGLRRMECLPIVQDDFPPDYKSVREMLVAKIKTCNAVVHLAGFYYGAEPQPTPPDPERRSFTQMEYEIAMELGLPCYVFLCGEKFPFDEHDPEPEEKRALQMAHRERLLSRDELFYEFDTREDLNSRTRELQLSVESLRDELAQERKRRRITMVISAVALLVALIGGIFLFSKTKTQEAEIAQTAEKLDEQGKLIEMLIAEQARLRDMGEDSGEIVRKAEENVAMATNSTPEEIRKQVMAAVVKAGESVDAARTGKGSLPAALRTLAEAQMAAGLATEMIASYRESLSLIDREENPLEWIGAATILGDTLASWDNQSDEGANLLVEAYDWAAGNPDVSKEDPAMLELMLTMSEMIPVDEGGLSRALFAYETRKEKLGPEDPKTLDAALDVSWQYRRSESHEEADALLNEVIVTREKLFGKEDPRTLNAKWRLMNSLSDRGRYSEAESMVRELIVICEKSLGEGHPETLGFRNSLGLIYDDQGDEERANEIFRELVKDMDRYLGPDDERTMLQKQLLSAKLRKKGEYAESEVLCRSVRDSLVRMIGVNQAETISAMGSLASSLLGGKKIEEYKEVMRAKIAAEISVFGADSPRVAKDQDALGVQLMVAGQYDLARNFLNEAYGLRKRILGEHGFDTLDTLGMMALNEHRAGEWAKAEELGIKAKDGLKASGEGRSELYAIVCFRLAETNEKLGQNDVALVYAQVAQVIAKEASAEDHWLHERTAKMIERLQ